MPRTMNKIVKARARVAAAKALLSEAMVATFPPGCKVVHTKGGSRISCTVLEHYEFGERAKVRNDKTDKVYWIDWYWLELR